VSAVSIRRARIEDAESATTLLRESITQLCVPDHKNDTETLREWFRNKTPEHFERWVRDEENYLVVAEFDSELGGVGRLHRSGDIRLCYVRPGRERLGIGRALLEALEFQAQDWGLTELSLQSSITARSFYERHGYVSAGEPTCGFGLTHCYPYWKVLPFRGEPNVSKLPDVAK
jgi:GNAT superfamily N-acetyltransferase